jgi:hypothetical protein
MLKLLQRMLMYVDLYIVRIWMLKWVVASRTLLNKSLVGILEELLYLNSTLVLLLTFFFSNFDLIQFHQNHNMKSNVELPTQQK